MVGKVGGLVSKRREDGRERPMLLDGQAALGKGRTSCVYGKEDGIEIPMLLDIEAALGECKRSCV